MWKASPIYGRQNISLLAELKIIDGGFYKYFAATRLEALLAIAFVRECLLFFLVESRAFPCESSLNRSFLGGRLICLDVTR